MADCGLDFLLEKMKQLINSDKELLVKVCEDKVIEKQEMEWVYGEMKVLRKFLKDSENIRDGVKEVVAKIRGVTHRVEDIIDSFLLFNTVLQTDGSVAGVEFPLVFNRSDDILKLKGNYCESVVMAKKINDCTKPLMNDIECIKRSKTEVMEILSWLESHIHPEKIHHGSTSESESDDQDRVIVIEVEEIKSLVQQVMEIYDKRSSSDHLRWLESSDEVDRLRSLSDKVLYWDEKDPDPFVRTESWSGKFRLHIPWFVPLLFCRFDEMVNLAEKIHHEFGDFVEELKPFTIQVTKIYEKGLSVTWLEPHIPDKFHLIFNSFQQIINLAEKIHHEFGGVIEASKVVSTNAMKGVKRRIVELISPTLAYVEMHRGLGDVTEDIKSIKGEVMEIYEKNIHGIRGVGQIPSSSSYRVSPRPTSLVAVDETIVGLDDEKSTIMDLLTEEQEKDLKHIAIVGMPGLGKTTLARNVYNDPFIVYHFYIRAWTVVSQAYQKRDILQSILTSADIRVLGNIGNMSDAELGEHFYKALKGKRYLVVMDDLWEMTAWDDLKMYFPNDRNGSRIVVTSRLVNVATALGAKPHSLRFLNEDESWDLLRLKAFRRETCPTELIQIGKELAKKCVGLPLAIVVVSGLVADNKTEKWWRHVCESLSSYISSSTKLQYMDAVALSYNHLPHYLKPCFVYFGAFPEDYEIPVRHLIWLWVAEGFIRENDTKSLEEVAEDYLIDLTDRGLVIVSKKRSDGGIKACRVHDLLRDLCLRKAEEDNFLQQISRYEESCYSFTNPFAYKQRRLCIHDNLVHCTSFQHSELYIRSFLSFGRSFNDLSKKDVSFVCQAFKLLRVLNLFSIKVLFVPKELEHLVHLRYLALHVEQEHFEPSISNLWNLETIIIDGPNGSFYLYDIWKMVNLRHVYSTRPIHIHGRIPDDGSPGPSKLDKLQTIGKLHGGHVLAWFPNLKKLKCQHDGFPKLDFLLHLETLNLIYQRFSHRPCFFHPDSFPPNLKSLTLSSFLLPWDQMSTLEGLPHLEILKLSYKAFEGPYWHTCDEGFHKLRFLKLQGLDIKKWYTSSDHFPSLQTLVLEDCQLLEEIPFCLGDVSTLEMIQVRSCSYSTVYSAKRIEEEQHDMGNDMLKVVIYSLNLDEVVFEDEDSDE